MSTETTVKITCDGCGKSRSVVLDSITQSQIDREGLWYRFEFELRSQRIVGQRGHSLVGVQLDACCSECVHRALAKLKIPKVDAAEPAP